MRTRNSIIAIIIAALVMFGGIMVWIATALQAKVEMGQQNLRVTHFAYAYCTEIYNVPVGQNRTNCVAGVIVCGLSHPWENENRRGAFNVCVSQLANRYSTGWRF